MEAYNLVMIEIGSLLSNTLILLFVLMALGYIVHTYVKYRRLYGRVNRKDKQKKLDEVH